MLFFLYALIIPYLEIIFSISTTRCTDIKSVIINVLLSYMAGLIVVFFVSLIRGRKWQKIAEICVMCLIPVLYYAEFLVYRSFKVFYDINTCLNGAGGAFKNFMGDILRLIFCFDGISRLVLMYIPLLLWIICKKQIRRLDEKTYKYLKDYLNRRNKEGVITAYRFKSRVFLIMAFVCYILALTLIYTDNAHANMYGKEYNYQSVVENMGLSTGLRLDIKNLILGTDESLEFEAVNNNGTDVLIEESGEGSFLTEATDKVDGDNYAENSNPENDDNRDLGVTPAEEESKEDTQPVEYGDNVLDIDFEELASRTSGINGELDAYISTLKPSRKNEYTGLFEGKNLIFLTAEAFSGYLVDEERTPTLYRLIHNGIYFEDFYQPSVAGTTGGEYSNLFGLMPTSGGKSIKMLTRGNTFITMGNQLNKRGYWGRTYHNNNGYVYDRYDTHTMLGYSEGFECIGNGLENYIEGSGFPASDYEMIKGTLTEYIDKQPFNVYYMTVSGHGQYSRKSNQMSCKNWDSVSDLQYSDMVKCYLAANMELENALTYLVKALEEAGIADNTVICLSPDHFPYGLDQGSSIGNMPNLSELYGFNVNSYIDRDKSSCILWSGCLEKMDPIVVSAPTESYDLLPTLCNLFGIDYDSRLYIGRDVLSDTEAIIFNGGYDFKTELGTYYSSKNKFVPISEDTEVPEGYVERIRQIVRNRYNFCKGVLRDDYYGHIYNEIYGEEKNTQ